MKTKQLYISEKDDSMVSIEIRTPDEVVGEFFAEETLLSTMEGKSIFKLICSEFGHKFSFHAVNLPTANMMLNEWCNYQSFNPVDFKVEETQDTSRIHDEYFTN